VGAVWAAVVSYSATQVSPAQELKGQLSDNEQAVRVARENHWLRNTATSVGSIVWVLLGVVLFTSDVRNLLKRAFPTTVIVAVCLLLGVSGCRRPFEPIKQEEISNSEEAFLIPYTGDGQKQESTNNEEYLRNNLVYTKQVRIPQQWVAKGYETSGPDGDWKDAAKLIKVDKAPVTREWTADPNTGTSNKNEAIWVMTSDQVEFSTGWTCTARIDSRDAAVKFLHNYPVGSLKEVMDGEVRAKLQATFGLEVTDLPMDELRKHATPHIGNTVEKVTKFFSERGIAITNLGITGGFIYRDKSIVDTMVKVFNAEQEKAIAAASTAAQEEKNKRILSEATGKAEAILKERKAEADGIKMVADAKAYEIEKANKDLQTYMALKQLEVEKARWEKWDGKFPSTLYGGGAGMPSLIMPLTPPERK
jgi:hypothetical protein